MADARIMSELRFHQIQQEAEQLIENLKLGDVSVGDSQFVQYEEKWATENGVGRFGRMTLKEGVRLFHAAPSFIDRRETLNFAERDFIGFAQSWASGTSVSPPARELVKDPVVPIPLYRKSRTIAFYERKLFELLGQATKITLVNPSFSTLTELKSSVGGYVTLTSGVEEKWTLDVRDYVNKSEGKLRMLPQRVVKGVAYLGTNQPVWQPTAPWCRLIISPFNDMSTLFDHFSVDIKEDMIVSKYRKNEQYTVTSILPRDTEGRMFNPKTVDAWLGQTHQLCYLESTYPMAMREVEEQKVQHTPWFCDYDGEWKELEVDVRWKVKGNQVQDVDAPGTYLSRRSLIPPPEGFVWSPLSTFGDHWVTYSSLKPHKQIGMSIETYSSEGTSQKILTFNNEKVLHSLYQCYPKEGQSFYLDSDQDIPILGNSGTLPSDDNIRSNFGGKPKKTFPFIYTDSQVEIEARYFTPHSLINSGVLYKLGGPKQQRGMMPRGSSEPIDSLITGLRSYVIVPKYTPGEFFAFSTMRKMADSLHLTSLFMTRWMTLDSLERGVQNPESGGFIKTNEEYQRIEEILAPMKVTWPTDVVKTVSQISQEVDSTPDYVYKFLQKLTRVYLWRADTKLRSMFVSEQGLRVQFAGYIVDNKDFFDGLMWRDAMIHLAAIMQTQTVVLKFVDRRVSLFVSFLEQNFFQVRIDEKISHIELIIRRGIWG